MADAPVASGAAGPGAAPYVNRNPYPGLRPFRADEVHLFFGRESQVDRMVGKLAARRFLAVVGTSGSGKSSLVNCGLRPALHRGYMAGAGAAWRIAQFRPGSDPIGALARALARPGVLFDADDPDDDLPLDQLVEATLRLGSLGLVDIVEQARLPAGVNLLVVADQFEELFRFRTLGDKADDKAAAQGGPAANEFGPREDAVAFVKLLLEAAVQQGLPIHVVLTMRSDFLGECAQFHGLPEAINDSQYLVPRLTREEIRAAVTGPVSVAGGEIAPVLVTRLLNDVGDNPDQLSILQHALNRTWAQWDNECEQRLVPGATEAPGPIEITNYLAIGGMQHALDQHAERAYAELGTAHEQRICEFVFRALTDKGTDPRGIRRPTRLAQLCAITGAAMPEVVAVIERFRKPSRSFLMPPQGEALHADSVIDISHESLMRVWRRLAAWADEEGESARVYRRVSETALLNAAGKAGLWRDPDLSLTLDWRSRDQPTAAWGAQYLGQFDAAMRFLDASRDAVAAEKVQAEIIRRWQAGWNMLPIAVVAVGFIFTQQPVARWLQAKLGSLGNATVSDWAQYLSHLLIGTLALSGYMLLSQYGLRLFKRAALRELARQDAAGVSVGEVLERQAQRDATSAVEVHDTGYALFWRRAAAHALDSLAAGVLCLFAIFVLILVLAVGQALGLYVIETNEAAAPAASAAAAASGPVLATAASAASAASAVVASGSAGNLLSNDAIGVLTCVLLLIVVWLYFALTMASSHRASPGMRAVGIFVTDLAGEPLSFGRATARYFASWLSYYSAFIGFFMQPFNARHQALHDMISGTVVLIKPESRRPESRRAPRSSA